MGEIQMAWFIPNWSHGIFKAIALTFYFTYLPACTHAHFFHLFPPLFWAFLCCMWPLSLFKYFKPICTQMFIAEAFSMLEASQIPIDEINEQNAVYACKQILFSPKKEGNPVTGYNMFESWGHYARWKKSVTKDKYGIIPLIWGIWNSQILRKGK